MPVEELDGGEGNRLYKVGRTMYDTYSSRKPHMTQDTYTVTQEEIRAELAEIEAARAARLEARAEEYFDSWEDGEEEI